jgi:hypothetical protein
METKSTTNLFASDVLHSEGHSRLSQEEIAKAVARHKREHPTRHATNTGTKPQKTSSPR